MHSECLDVCLIVTKVPVALAGRVRHAETETTFTREEACYTHRFLETGGMETLQVYTGKYHGPVRRQRRQRKLGKCRGPAPAGSKGTLRMDGVSK